MNIVCPFRLKTVASLDMVSPGAEYNECDPGCHPTRKEVGCGAEPQENLILGIWNPKWLIFEVFVVLF